MAILKKQPQPKIRIPAEYKAHRQLVAVSEQDYATLRAHSETAVFKKRSLTKVRAELTAAYPNDPDLITDIVEGLKRSSLYAKRPATSR